MAVAIDIKMFGDRQFIRRIRAMRYRARNMSPVLQEVGEDMLDIIEEQFETEGRRSGSRWKELSFWTVQKRGSAHPILVDNANLLLEVTDESNLLVTDDSVTVQIRDPKLATIAESHQYGYRNSLTGNLVPARPIIDFTDMDRLGFRRKITNFLVRGDYRLREGRYANR